MAALDYLRIIRPANCLIAAAAVFIGFSVASGKIWFQAELLPAMLSAFLICGAGQAINDYFDREIDRKIRPEKAIPSGKIKPANALIYSLALFAAGMAISYYVNPTAFAIASAFSLILISYSTLMKKIKFLGNFVVAGGTAFTLIYGAAVVGEYKAATILALSAFLVNLGREITKDAEDIKADRGFKKTLPMVLPERAVQVIVFALYVLGIIVAASAWMQGLVKNPLYLVLLAASGLGFMYSSYLLLKKEFRSSQQFSKYAMVAALAAFLLGVA